MVLAFFAGDSLSLSLSHYQLVLLQEMHMFSHPGMTLLAKYGLQARINKTWNVLLNEI